MGLWLSRFSESDERLVIAETAVDALSYAALHNSERSRFASLAGSMNDQQPALLVAAVQKLPRGALVIGAFDNDEAGDNFLEKVRMILKDKDVIDDRPETRGDDWNDVLRLEKSC